jgi:hypothetical protein
MRKHPPDIGHHNCLDSSRRPQKCWQPSFLCVSNFNWLRHRCQELASAFRKKLFSLFLQSSIACSTIVRSFSGRGRACRIPKNFPSKRKGVHLGLRQFGS